MAVQKFLRGELIRISTEVLNQAGIAVDPASLTLKVKTPDGNTATYTWSATITRESLGRFFKDIQVAQPGRHFCRWESTGPTSASEVEFIVQKGDF